MTRWVSLLVGAALAVQVLGCGAGESADTSSKGSCLGPCGPEGEGAHHASSGTAGTGGDFFNGGNSAGAGVGGVSSADRDQSAFESGADAGVSGAVDPETGLLPVSNPFVLTAHDPFSTFAADVDTASYDIFRRDVTLGIAPDPSSVRVEDFVNYFEYDYEAPEKSDAHPFRIALSAAEDAFGRGTALLRVGIQALNPPAFEKKPTNLVFLIDVSGSMQSAEKLPLVQSVLEHGLDVLNAADTVSIVTYASGTEVKLEPTPVAHKSQIVSVIDGLSAGGSTNGEGGIQLAYAQAQAGFIEGGINHVILCTDGDFNVGASSDEALVALIEEKRKSGVTLTALGFGIGDLNDRMMEKVSNAGNGIYSVISSETQASRYAEERMLATLVHVAKDMKIQVELNPEHVTAYRLIGYVNRAIADEDFRNDVVDAGEVGAGHRVTALYELVLAGDEVPTISGAPEVDDGKAVAGEREIDASSLVLVKVRYKQPNATESDPASEVVSTLAPAAVLASVADADADLRWAGAVAELAEILQSSPYGDEGRLDVLADVFEAQATRDIDRSELLDLFETWRSKL